MSEPTQLPKEKVLCGILYNITVHEGLVVFEQAICMWGCHTRLIFERTEEKGGGLWYLQTSATWDKVSVNHIVKAYELLCEVYGGAFEEKQPV